MEMGSEKQIPRVETGGRGSRLERRECVEKSGEMKKGERIESGITGYKRGRERTSANFKERKRIMNVVRVCWFYLLLSWSEIWMSGSKEVDYGMLYVLFLLYVSYVTCASLERGISKGRIAGWR